MDPKVSMIIPVYKTAAWLPKCVESCLSQTYGNIEIILIDDGSPDDCGEICDRYAEKDARITVIHQKNGGVSAARNAGLKKASGELIQFVDSDDWIDPDMVSCLVKEQLAGRYDLVVCGVRAYFKQQIVSKRVPPKKEICGRIDLISVLLSHKDAFYFISPWDKLYKKSIIDEFALAFDTSLKYGEDFSFVLDYLEHAESCAFVDKIFYNYQHLTYDKSAHYQTLDVDYQWDQGIKLFNNYKELFVNTGTYAGFKGKVDTYLLWRIKDFLNNTVFSGCPGKTVTSKLRTIPASDTYEDLKAIRLSDTEDFLEKIILICCRHRLWNLLYNCFKIKVGIYNKVYRKAALRINR